MTIRLPFPSSALSGHAKGRGWYKRSAATKQHRTWARNATLVAMSAGGIVVRASGDIPILIRFTPANLRGDRVNFPNRMKAYIDGIADALGINDSRFLPSYEYCAPDADKIGFVEVMFL